MLPDVTPKILPEATEANSLLPEATDLNDSSGTIQPDETTETPPAPTEMDSMLPDATRNSLESLPDKTINSETVSDITKPSLDLPDETLATNTVVSVQREQLITNDGENVETVDHGEQPETTPTVAE